MPGLFRCQGKRKARGPWPQGLTVSRGSTLTERPCGKCYTASVCHIPRKVLGDVISERNNVLVPMEECLSEERRALQGKKVWYEEQWRHVKVACMAASGPGRLHHIKPRGGCKLESLCLCSQGIWNFLRDNVNAVKIL